MLKDATGYWCGALFIKHVTWRTEGDAEVTFEENTPRSLSHMVSFTHTGPDVTNLLED